MPAHWLSIHLRYNRENPSWKAGSWWPSSLRLQALGFPSTQTQVAGMTVGECTSPWSCRGAQTRPCSSLDGHTGPIRGGTCTCVHVHMCVCVESTIHIHTHMDYRVCNTCHCGVMCLLCNTCYTSFGVLIRLGNDSLLRQSLPPRVISSDCNLSF